MIEELTVLGMQAHLFAILRQVYQEDHPIHFYTVPTAILQSWIMRKRLQLA